MNSIYFILKSWCNIEFTGLISNHRRAVNYNSIAQSVLYIEYIRDKP